MLETDYKFNIFILNFSIVLIKTSLINKITHILSFNSYKNPESRDCLTFKHKKIIIIL